ncbi:annexin D5 [Rutidosis leptorrhynchoides]|uniref:annexin D5 n=1 Tax=Rutidosis leptorrhynchoides TaxID=125765 RepID=UPI003A992F30
MSTVTIPAVVPSPHDDALQLYRAFKGLGCDTSTVINILSHRNASQRSLIQEEYTNMYNDDLNKKLASELHHNTKRAVLQWMPEPVLKDATIIRQSIGGGLIDHKDLRAATEIICSRTPSQLRKIKTIYSVAFGDRLDQELEISTSGNHKKLLIAYVNTTRYEGPEIDLVLVESDAKSLAKGSDESTFINIFSDRSSAHLVALAIAFQNNYGKPFERRIKKATSGHFQYALLSIIRCAENSSKYFAKVLRRAMKGIGTDDTTLIRVVVTRVELDMQEIKAEYKSKYGKTLNDAVHSETSGSYRNFLLSLLGPNI